MSRSIKIFLVFLLFIPCVGIGLRPGGDLYVYYRAAQLVLADPLRVYTESVVLGGSFPYGPAFLSLLLGISRIPFADLHWLWLGMESICYLFFWIALFRLYPVLLEHRVSWLFVLVWAVSIKPIHASFQSYNLQLLFAAVFLYAELLSRDPRNGKQLSAGLLISLLTSFKVYMAFGFVYFFLTKTSGVRRGLLLGFVLAFALPLAVFGPSVFWPLHQQFLQELGRYHQAYSLAHMTVNLSLPSMIARWFEFLGAGLSERLAALVSIVLMIVYFIKTAIDARKGRLWSMHDTALALALMALLNSGSRPDYFIYYVPAFCSLVELRQAKQLPRWAPGVVLASFVLISLISEWTLGSRDLNHYLEGLRVPVVGMLLLCFTLLHSILKSARPNICSH